jgi:hypothetical protein
MEISDILDKKDKKFNNRDFDDKHKAATKDQQIDQTTEQINPLDFNPKAYTSATYTTTQQAKDKLSTTATRKAVFKKLGLFENINNLDMNYLYYVIPETQKDTFNLKAGYSNKLPKDKKDNLRLPDLIYGGGENDLIPVDGIDFKKTYNSEAQALI